MQNNKRFTESTAQRSKPFRIYLVCDSIEQFDAKFISDLEQTNCNLVEIKPTDVGEIKKNRALKAIISVPELSIGCGFRLLNSLRQTLGTNVPLMVFETEGALA